MVESYECLLPNIICLLAFSQHTNHRRGDLRFVTLYQFTESSNIALTRDPQQFFVRLVFQVVIQCD